MAALVSDQHFHRHRHNTMVTAEKVRELLRPHGLLRPQPASDWSGTIPLPNAIADFYRNVGPDNITIETYGNPIVLPSLAELWQHQTGYRWSLDGQNDPGWKDEWIVVAFEGGAGFIFTNPLGQILLAVHGWGDSDPIELFPDLNTMAACLAILGTVAMEAGNALTDADSFVRPEHRATAVRRLTPILGSDQQVELALGELGWTWPWPPAK